MLSNYCLQWDLTKKNIVLGSFWKILIIPIISYSKDTMNSKECNKKMEPGLEFTQALTELVEQVL